MRRYPYLNPSILAFLLPIAITTLVGVAYGAPSSNPASRIVSAVNESDLVQLVGNTHPLAIPAFDQGAVVDSLPMEHIFVELRRSPEQEQALERLTSELQDPHSVNYHQWLT